MEKIFLWDPFSGGIFLGGILEKSEEEKKKNRSHFVPAMSLAF